MYQFIHIETYARSSSKKTKPTNKKTSVNSRPKSTMSDVIAESLRVDTHCSHIEKPWSPTWLVGDASDLLCLDYEVEKKIEAEKARTGRTPRKDTHVLLAGVASYPSELAKADQAGFDRWQKNTIDWLRDKYGTNLRAVLRHDDEAHPHIHFFVCDRTRMNAKELHDGYAAAAHLPSLSKEATRAYADAMREFQSDYYAKVGHAAGLLRDGPKRKRMSRDSYKATQREARERVALDAQSEQARSELLNDASVEAQKAADLRREHERQMAIERAELNQLRDQNQRDRAALDDGWQRARETMAKAEKAFASVEAQRKNLDVLFESVDRRKAELEKEIAATKQERAMVEAEKASLPKFDYQTKGILQTLEAEPKWKALVLEATNSDRIREALLSIANEDENDITQDAQKPIDHTKGFDKQTPAQAVYQSTDSYGL